MVLYGKPFFGTEPGDLSTRQKDGRSSCDTCSIRFSSPRLRLRLLSAYPISGSDTDHAILACPRITCSERCGQLTAPSAPHATDMPHRREALSIPKSTDILEHINSLPPPEQEDAQEIIRGIERRAMEHQAPQPGLQTLMNYLDKRGMQKGICTRNFE